MSVKRRQEPEVRSGFDFTGLPLAQTSRVLANAGARVLDKALGSPDPIDLSPLSDLTNHKIFIERSGTPFTRPSAFSAMDGLIFSWRRLVRLLRSVFGVLLPRLHDRLGGDETNERLAYRSIVKHAIINRITPRARRLLLEERLASRLEGVWLMPDEMWDLVAETAWTEPRFRYLVSRKVRAYLHDRVVFSIGEIPSVSLAKQTFWLLLAMEQEPPSSLRARFSARKRRRSAALAQFRALAMDRILAEGWAGFWDQWLIAQMLRANPRAPFALHPKLREAVTSLPLLKKAHLRYEPISDRRIPQLAHAHWDVDLPGWLEQFYPTPDHIEDIAAPSRFRRFLSLFRFKKMKRSSMNEIQPVSEGGNHV